jgi:hypothetical protein
VKSWVSTWVVFKDGITDAIAIGDSSTKFSVCSRDTHTTVVDPPFRYGHVGSPFRLFNVRED